jgi:glycosyltransferase involved in cell wall biosynthesis
MRVSVAIPVYNAARYVREAVESALAQPETAEVLLVEDGSPDNSLAVCRELAAEHATVRLLRHPDGGNRGAGASRNLAVRQSNCDYVAFLDADDFYLPGRFSVAGQLFTTMPEIEGVYEAIGMYVEDKTGADRWAAAGRASGKLMTITEEILPEQLFVSLVKGNKGAFSPDGLVVRRTVFQKTGWFPERLSLHQDTVMNIKLAAVAKLVPGRLDEPVAMWRVHDQNRISAKRSNSRIYRDVVIMMWATLWQWGRENLGQEKQQLLVEAFLNAASFHSRFDRPFPHWARGIQKRVQLVMLPFAYPRIAGEVAFWRRFVPNLGFWAQRLLDKPV